MSSVDVEVPNGDSFDLHLPKQQQQQPQQQPPPPHPPGRIVFPELSISNSSPTPGEDSNSVKLRHKRHSVKELNALRTSALNSEGRPSRKSEPPEMGAGGRPSGNFLRVVEADDDLSDWESPIDVDLVDLAVRKSQQSSWRKIRSFILWSPFIQVFKKHRYPWIQLAGHQGNFQAGDAGSVLKKLDAREQSCFRKVMADPLRDYVPEYRGDVEKNGDTFIQLQDLLCSFTQPSAMDIKMGVRTYLEEELHKARKSATLRKDMYQKMLEIDSNAPTAEEHQQKAVTKPRYMQWRDEMSSSAELGFRVEGIKKADGNSSKDFKTTKSRKSVVEAIRSFVGGNQIIVTKYIRRLKDLMHTQETSPFFTSHEVIGSSLLFVHDTDENVSIWMIDFGKTEPLPESVAVDHRTPWKEGNHEDGYLFGLDNLVSVLEEIEAGFMSSSV